jgi:hypothetical protein
MSSNDPNDIRHVKTLGDKYKTKTELEHFKEAYGSLGGIHFQLQKDFKALQAQLEKLQAQLEHQIWKENHIEKLWIVQSGELRGTQDQLEKSVEREAILLEAVESIKKHQEISLPLDDRMRKLSTIWFIANKSLEKLKTIS